MKKTTLILSTLFLCAFTASTNAQEKTIQKSTKLEKPIVLAPTNVTTHGFTANWQKVDNAEAYCVFVYTEHVADKDETYTLLNENFDLIDFGNIGNPVWSDELYENLDMYTTLPNWSVYGYTTYVQGMVGGIIYSPYIDLRNNNGKYTVKLSVYGVAGDKIVVESDGTKEETQEFAIDHTGITTKSLTFTNGRQDTFFSIHNTTGTEYYLDEASVTQNLKAGDKAYVYVDLNDAVPGENTSVDFKRLRYAPKAETVYYDLYAVVREYNDPEHPDRYEQVYSDFSDKMKVVLNPDATGITENNASDIKVSTSENGIVISLDKTSNVNICDMSGRLVVNGKYSAGRHSINLPAGNYIVRINKNTYKISTNF